jgi:hypothetical protein
MSVRALLLLALIVSLGAGRPILAAAPVAAPSGPQIEIPPNAQLNGRGDGWVCSYGYRRTGKTCTEITVPRNATLGPYGDLWICLPGYFTYRGICLPEEGADRESLEKPSKMRPWQLMKKLTASAQAQSQPKPASGRSQNEMLYRVGPLIAAAMALGIWMFFFGDREPVARPRNYAGTAIVVKRPQRAVTVVNAWKSAGDRVDALTGAFVPDSVEVSQCRNCRVFYRKESLVELRRQNGGSCISCGRAAFQAVAS